MFNQDSTGGEDAVAQKRRQRYGSGNCHDVEVAAMSARGSKGQRPDLFARILQSDGTVDLATTSFKKDIFPWD